MDKQPYTHLFGFAVTSDLKHIVFATKRNTQKFQNITRNTHIAAFIDNRQNTQLDFSDAITVTPLGTAKEISNSEKEKEYQTLLLQKHPNLSLFLADLLCVLIEIRVTVYQVVQKFEELQVLSFINKK